VAEIYKDFWAFLGIASPDCSGFKKQSHFFRGSALYLCWISIQKH
jgi:hypothetical protein